MNTRAYRPSIWRRVQEGDLDHMRVIIEAFLAVVERVLPEQFLATVTGQRIVAKRLRCGDFTFGPADMRLRRSPDVVGIMCG